MTAARRPDHPPPDADRPSVTSRGPSATTANVPGHNDTARRQQCAPFVGKPRRFTAYQAEVASEWIARARAELDRARGGEPA